MYGMILPKDATSLGFPHFMPHKPSFSIRVNGGEKNEKLHINHFFGRFR
jgi:hypothetical protein